MKLKGKHALITGHRGAIGAAIASLFANEGCEVETSGDADVSSQADIEALMARVKKKFGTLDILVLAAGTNGSVGLFEEASPVEWMRAIETNLLGTMLCIRYSLPLLRKSGSAKIITFAGGGEWPLPRFSSYVASKAAVLRLTETLAAELAPDVDINAISPGLVNSGLAKKLIAMGKEKVGTQMYRSTLKQLSGEEETAPPEKAAALAVFLASEASNGLSGRNISAVWDHWRDIPKHLAEIMNSDIYTARRIKPKDRGYDWK